MALLHIVDPPIHPGTGKRGTYAHLKNAIDYILKPEKTMGGLYTGSLGCSCENALKEMIETKQQYGKEPQPGTEEYEHDRLAYHFVLSWSPEEQVSPETALEITRKFCEEILQDYEVVYSAHTDQAHMHTHIIFNSVNYKTGRKYRYKKNDWEKILQPLLDRLCAERGLHKLEDDTGKTLEEHAAERWRKKMKPDNFWKRKKTGHHSYQNDKNEEYSLSDYIREDIDNLVREAGSFSEFERRLKEMGYEMKYGNSEKYGEYMAVKTSGMKKFRRTQTLGADYALSMIKSRIAAYHSSLSEGQDEEESEEGFLFRKMRFRCRIYYRTDNPYLRKQYARLYRLGVIAPHEKHLPYWEIRKRLKELRKVEFQLNMIAEKNYRSGSDIDSDIQNLECEIKDLKSELSSLRVESKPYKDMAAIYQEMERLEGDLLLFQEGDVRFQKGAEKYEELKKQAALFPHSKEELAEYLERHDKKVQEKKRELQEERKKCEALKMLKKEYQHVMEEYAPADKKILEKLEQNNKEMEMREKKKGKER
ncbi:MAG: relaxase/mobilization nuclease domain-containing protein [Eubacterium sp.]|nr:relaxase/mobilization nuclease domain-containing protein [Eubacterium sp.]